MKYAYYNGNFAAMDEIRIPLSDRALFFGDGVYDVAVGKDSYAYLLDEHIERILGNAKRLHMPALPEKKELEELIYQVVEKSREESFLVYFQLSRSLNFRAHSAEKCKKTNILITVQPFELYNKIKNVRLISKNDTRHFHCDIKTINLLPAVIASSEAEACSCDECVFLRDGYVTECAHSNIAIVKHGEVITHPLDNLILPGITRRHFLELCGSLGINKQERPFTREELMSADEIIIMSTTKLLRRVYEIDGIRVGCKNSELFQRLSAGLHDKISSLR